MTSKIQTALDCGFSNYNHAVAGGLPRLRRQYRGLVFQLNRLLVKYLPASGLLLNRALMGLFFTGALLVLLDNNLVVAQQTATQSATNSNPVVATVGGHPITSEELGAECVKRYGNQVLESLINKKLIQQACDAKSITITNQDVTDEIARIATKNELSMQMYLKLIKDERGIGAAQYANDIVWPMIALRRIAADEIRVPQADVDKAFEAEYGPTVKVRMIVVSDATHAQQLHQQAVANPDEFKRLAKRFSEDKSSASVEGLLPPIRKHSGDKIEQVAFGLMPGEISEVFTVNDLHLFLQCVRHEAGTPPNSQQVPLIQERIRRDLRDTKLQSQAKLIFAKLRENSRTATVIGNPELEQKYPGVAAFINDEPLSMAVLTDNCISRFGSLTLEGEINRKRLEIALDGANKQVTDQDIADEIGRAAAYYGFLKSDNTPDVDAWLAEVKRSNDSTMEMYRRDAVWPTVALKKLIENRVQVTEEDLRMAFDTNHGPRAEVLAIVCASQKAAEDVWAEARDNPTDDYFGALAHKHSIEPQSRSNYGKVVPLRRNGGQPTLERIAFDLQPGEMSGVIGVGGQYVILRLQGFTEPLVSDFEAVRQELYDDVLERKTRVEMRRAMDELVKNTPVENYLELAEDAIKLNSTAQRSPRKPRG